MVKSIAHNDISKKATKLKTTLQLHDRCDWPPKGGCDGLVEPQWAEDEDEEAEDAGGVEEAREVIMDIE